MLKVISAVITLSVKCALRGQTFRACGIITISKYSALVGDLQYNAENAAIYSGLFCVCASERVQSEEYFCNNAQKMLNVADCVFSPISPLFYKLLGPNLYQAHRSSLKPLIPPYKEKC